jgi:hypothetical protein
MAALVVGVLTCAGTAQAAIRPAAAKPTAPHHAAAPHRAGPPLQHATSPYHPAPRRTTVRRSALRRAFTTLATTITTVAALPRDAPDPAPPVADTFLGGAFDTCAAPSAATMDTWWGASEFKAVGVYLGGVNRACPMGNLSAPWVQQVSAQGWKLIPAYVGLQPPCVTAPHMALMTADGAQTQATAAADDAAAQAAALDFEPGSAIYYDLENYRRDDAACTKTVLSYLSTWALQLHTHGYLAGVYSSAGSGITDLAKAVGTPGWTAPDAIWIARWDKDASTSDPAVPTGDWSQHQRIKQFSGGHRETHGPVSITVDGNFVDGPVAIVD